MDFSKDEKKEEAHWQRDKDLKDILVHLYEWIKLTWTGCLQTTGEAKSFCRNR